MSTLSNEAIDLSSSRRVHLIGVGGSGMSAIAEILHGTGHVVSGSDLRRSAPLDRLTGEGLNISIGHAADNLGNAEIVARSTAIPDDNPEVRAAVAKGIAVLRRAELLRAITAQWQTISVAGTHGKTTTSAMLTTALQGCGLDPAYIVGGDLRDLGHGAAVGSGSLLVVEADESDGTFVELVSSAVVITNVEPDHLEHYGGFAGLQQAFVRFLEQCEGPKLVCADDPGTAQLAATVPGVSTYGESTSATWQIVDPLPTPSGISFSVNGPDGIYEIHLQQPGLYNAKNATAALGMAASLGADPTRAAAALSGFGGVGRRFERRGEVGGITFVDDYAHLPTEVSVALAAARSLAPERLVAVFQPHRYSRTEQLWSTFGDSFVEADLLIITEIYASGEQPRSGVTGQLIADDVRQRHPHLDVRFIAELDDVAAELVQELRSGDLCMTLGAGDLTFLPDRVVGALNS
ncbi:MAG: UDP-N-acetylmuramate--alanine ligase [Acidimicrobiales bacterium]|jgi:UDP-N-acetylmuramate--alanine ligase